MTQLCVFALLALGPRLALGGDACASEGMLHTRTVLTAPGVSGDQFGAKPKDLYRLGSTRGRLEEAPDLARSIHALVVVNEADVWIVNLLSGTGQHIVDPGPTIRFWAPILSDSTDDYWSRLEYGCEVRFMTELGVEGVRSAGDESIQYAYEHEGVRVVLRTSPAGVPQRLDVSRPDLSYSITYQVFEYRPADLSLFEKPRGIAFSEPKSE